MTSESVLTYDFLPGLFADFEFFEIFYWRISGLYSYSY